MTQTCLATDVANVVVETLELDPSDIHDGLAMGTVPQWDSLGHVNLIVALESRYNLQVPAEQIPELVSLPAIVTYVESHAAEAAP